MRSLTIARARQDRMLAMYESADGSVTMGGIGWMLGCDQSTVSKGIRKARERRRAGIVTPPVPMALHAPASMQQGRRKDPERDAWALAYRRAGYSWPEVARLAGFRAHSSAMVACGRACKAEAEKVG